MNDRDLLDTLSARHEIENLITRYCIACDDRDLETLLSLFADDAYFGHIDGVRGKTGHGGLKEHFLRTLGVMGPTYHWSHDRFFELDPTDKTIATGKVLGHFEASMAGVGYISGIRYTDRYSQVDGKWQFAWRGYQFLYLVRADEYGSALARTKRVWRYGTWEEADLPESLGSWNDFQALVLSQTG